MKKEKRIISTQRVSRKERKSTKSKKINLSDIPELSDNELSSMRRIGAHRRREPRTHCDSFDPEPVLAELSLSS